MSLLDHLTAALAELPRLSDAENDVLWEAVPDLEDILCRAIGALLPENVEQRQAVLDEKREEHLRRVLW